MNLVTGLQGTMATLPRQVILSRCRYEKTEPRGTLPPYMDCQPAAKEPIHGQYHVENGQGVLYLREGPSR